MSGSGTSWAICKSAPRSRQITMPARIPPLSFYRPDALPAAQPTASKHWRHLTDLLYWFIILPICIKDASYVLRECRTEENKGKRGGRDRKNFLKFLKKDWTSWRNFADIRYLTEKNTQEPVTTVSCIMHKWQQHGLPWQIIIVVVVKINDITETPWTSGHDRWMPQSFTACHRSQVWHQWNTTRHVPWHRSWSLWTGNQNLPRLWSENTSISN